MSERNTHMFHTLKEALDNSDSGTAHVGNNVFVQRTGNGAKVFNGDVQVGEIGEVDLHSLHRRLVWTGHSCEPVNKK